MPFWSRLASDPTSGIGCQGWAGERHQRGKVFRTASVGLFIRYSILFYAASLPAMNDEWWVGGRDVAAGCARVAVARWLEKADHAWLLRMNISLHALRAVLQRDFQDYIENTWSASPGQGQPRSRQLEGVLLCATESFWGRDSAIKRLESRCLEARSENKQHLQRRLLWGSGCPRLDHWIGIHTECERCMSKASEAASRAGKQKRVEHSIWWRAKLVISSYCYVGSVWHDVLGRVHCEIVS